ncbi:type II CRISPR-associated endonuclease Cas1 [Slackia heliotrinireducens]|uniref:type II CRISPR-associated endonuclease Cas1 n=1 Tax=Slackia heliotrinireducens TaxID=84110 RepID=UPI00331481BA
MGFRIVEIHEPSELHVKSGQLSVEQAEHSVTIPLEDIESLVLAGPSIRVSSQALALMADAGIMVVVCGTNQRPSAMLMATEANVRHTLVSREQLARGKAFRDELWRAIVKQKILNQARCLELLGRPGAPQIRAWARDVLPGDRGNNESSAAREYFPLLHEGLNRRSDDPFNSVLNYGYAIIRSSIVKALVATGFITCIGLHHNSQFNTFNLADDMIEPFRPMVDVVAPSLVTSSSWLSKQQRHALVGVLQHKCVIGGTKTSISHAVERSVDSLRRAIALEDPGQLELPTIVEPKAVSGVDE